MGEETERLQGLECGEEREERLSSPKQSHCGYLHMMCIHTKRKTLRKDRDNWGARGIGKYDHDLSYTLM